MGLLGTLAEKAPARVFVSIFLGCLAGVLYALLIPIVLNAVSGGGIDPADSTDSDLISVLGVEVRNRQAALLFFVACLAILLFRTISQVTLARVSMETTANLRRRVYRAVLNTSVRNVENIGAARIQSALSMDVGRIVMGARLLPDLIINLVTLFGMLLYLFVLNDGVFRFVVLAIVFGVVTYSLPIYVARQHFRRSAQKVDGLYEHISGLLLGLKELKINRNKEHRYYHGILSSAEEEIASIDKLAHSISRVGANYGDMIGFFVIGILTFIFVNYEAISSGQMLGVIMVLLYLTAPVAIVINFAPQISLAKLSLARIDELLQLMVGEGCASEIAHTPEWDRIAFHDVRFVYGESNFTVGPVTFELRRGEVTFLVGGNGSGKSTLARLISLHYQPDSGYITFGDTRLTGENLVSYRQKIAAIHSDFHLFEELLDQSGIADEARISAYLRRLELAEKVQVRNGRFSTTRLSEGQRKRLALLVCYADDKEVYIFDEWAADQDPLFKEVFYLQILRDLKAMGKTVILCSHDDRYFHVADRILRMDNGQIRPVQLSQVLQYAQQPPLHS